jgi:hypothetical protein
MYFRLSSKFMHIQKIRFTQIEIEIEIFYDHKIQLDT